MTERIVLSYSSKVVRYKKRRDGTWYDPKSKRNGTVMTLDEFLQSFWRQRFP